MENEINIAELLKNCPEGTELDCLLYDTVTLKSVDDDTLTPFPIKVLRSDGCQMLLTRFGKYSNTYDAKCIIFPKGKTSWEGFIPPCQFKQGDIVTCGHSGEYIWTSILKETPEKIGDNYFISDYCSLDCEGEFLPYDSGADSATWIRIATEDEKEKLFEAIKRNNYEWNAETNTFRQIETNVSLIESSEIKKEDLMKSISKIDFTSGYVSDKVQLILGEEREIKEENGEYYVVKKCPEYPKTYKDCCIVLGIDVTENYIEGYKARLIECLQNLIICRDAYWKIAGDEMGLGKPWEPDWNNISDKYCIYFVSGDAWSKECQTRQCPFAFPTPEMRDAFKDNFDNDIKLCETLYDYGGNKRKNK